MRGKVKGKLGKLNTSLRSLIILAVFSLEEISTLRENFCQNRAPICSWLKASKTYHLSNNILTIEEEKLRIKKTHILTKPPFECIYLIMY